MCTIFLHFLRVLCVRISFGFALSFARMDRRMGRLRLDPRDSGLTRTAGDAHTVLYRLLSLPDLPLSLIRHPTSYPPRRIFALTDTHHTLSHPIISLPHPPRSRPLCFSTPRPCIPHPIAHLSSPHHRPVLHLRCMTHRQQPPDAASVWVWDARDDSGPRRAATLFASFISSSPRLIASFATFPWHSPVLRP